MCMYMHKKDKIYMNYANNEDTSRKEAYYDGTIIKNRELSHYVKRDLLHMYILYSAESSFLHSRHGVRGWGVLFRA